MRYNFYNFFLKCLIEFINESDCFLCSLFCKVVNYWFILNGLGLIQHIYIFLGVLWHIVFLAISPFYPYYQRCGHSYFIIILFISMVSAVNFLLSLLILSIAICVCSVFSLLKLNAKLLQLYLTLWDPMDSSLPGPSVHGIF